MNSNFLEPPMKDRRNSPSRDLQDNNNPLVLIVEDHADTREVLRILLNVIGCRVIEAEDGEQAMSIAEKSRPDLILLDMRIPLLNGLEVTRLIRSDANLSEVPIVAVTGKDAPQFKVDDLKAGCNGCLVKPIDFDRLEELITTFIRPAARHHRSYRRSARWLSDRAV